MKYIIKAKNKNHFKDLENLLDSYQADIQILAYSKEHSYFVADIFSKNAIRHLNNCKNEFEYFEEDKFFRK